MYDDWTIRLPFTEEQMPERGKKISVYQANKIVEAYCKENGLVARQSDGGQALDMSLGIGEYDKWDIIMPKNDRTVGRAANFGDFVSITIATQFTAMFSGKKVYWDGEEILQ